MLRELKKDPAGKKLSSVLVAEADVAAGYYQLSLAYTLDPYADAPLKLAGPGRNTTAAPATWVEWPARPPLSRLRD